MRMPLQCCPLTVRSVQKLPSIASSESDGSDSESDVAPNTIVYSTFQEEDDGVSGGDAPVETPLPGSAACTHGAPHSAGGAPEDGDGLYGDDYTSKLDAFRSEAEQVRAGPGPWSACTAASAVRTAADRRTLYY